MGYIEEQIAERYHKGELPDENVVLFNCTHESRLMACALINRGITPKGLIAPDQKVKKEYKSIWGIPVYTANEFYKEFRRNAFVVMHDWDFYWWRGWFEGKGYSIDHKLMVIKPPQVNAKFQWLQRRFHGLAVLVERWNKFRKLWLGYSTYCKLRRKYGAQTPIYVYDYDGLGDAYVFGALIKAQLGDDAVVTVRKAGLKKVLDMVGVHHVEVLSEEQSQALYKMLCLHSTPPRLEAMTPVPQSIHTDILWCIYGPKLNMLDMYKVYLNLPLDQAVPIEEPVPVPSKEIDRMFRDRKLKFGKAVVLSPFSNSLVSFPYAFWEQLAKALRKMGLKVIMNSVGDEYTLPGTVTLDYPLKDAPYVVERAGYFVGVRSGFCDIVSNADALKIVISPKMEKVNFNGHIFKAFSFEEMQVGRNTAEFEWKYEDFDELIHRICAILREPRKSNVFQ